MLTFLKLWIYVIWFSFWYVCTYLASRKTIRIYAERSHSTLAEFIRFVVMIAVFVLNYHFHFSNARLIALSLLIMTIASAITNVVWFLFASSKKKPTFFALAIKLTLFDMGIYLVSMYFIISFAFIFTFL